MLFMFVNAHADLSFLFQLAGVARYRDGTYAEKNIEIRMKVVDENDNAPVFGVINPGAVSELSPAGQCFCFCVQFTQILICDGKEVPDFINKAKQCDLKFFLFVTSVMFTLRVLLTKKHCIYP